MGEKNKKIKTDFDRKTDLMVEENRKVLQRLAIIEEERDQLKASNEVLRTEAKLGSNQLRTSRSESSKSPVREVQSTTVRKPLTPKKVIAPVDNHQNIQNQPPQNPTSSNSFDTNQSLLPAFLALERQLTLSQKNFDRLDYANKTNEKEIQNLKTEKLELEKQALASLQAVENQRKEMSNYIPITEHEQIMKYSHANLHSQIVNLGKSLENATAEKNDLLEKVNFHEKNDKIIEEDAKNLVKKSKEISKLKQEILALKQKLKLATVKKSDKMKKEIFGSIEGQEVLRGKIKLLEQELFERDKLIEKYERNLTKFKQLREISQGDVSVSPIKDISPATQTTIDSKNSTTTKSNEAYQQAIISLEHQLFDAKQTIDKLQKTVRDNFNHNSNSNLFKNQYDEEVAKNQILNKMLLEEKESVRLMEKSHKLEIEKAKQEGQIGKEAQMLVVDANEKLQMALSREQTLIQKTND